MCSARRLPFRNEYEAILLPSDLRLCECVYDADDSLIVLSSLFPSPSFNCALLHDSWYALLPFFLKRVIIRAADNVFFPFTLSYRMYVILCLRVCVLRLGVAGS
jgi:hypothetical protein